MFQDKVNSNHPIGDQKNKHVRIWKNSGPLPGLPGNFHPGAPQAVQQDNFGLTKNERYEITRLKWTYFYK